MNVPNLPTDNLYKFMAIFGLIIFVFSLYLITSLRSNANDLIIQYNHENSNFNRRYDKVWEEYNQLLEKYHIERNTDSINVIISAKDSTELKEIIKSLRQAELAIEKVEADNVQYKLEKEKNKIEYLINSSDSWEMKILFLFGLIMMNIGFFLWYHKNQIYIDAETKYKGETFLELVKEAEKIKKQKEKEEKSKPKIEDSEP
ncbi:hypothetical protein CLV90_2040 [Maribacter spongiicola]|uniref:Uncharacterized protein n=1 Tax=Maribacter spongiicola TaxID=1206753 RepID=A0A4R7K265_9FLAO|nr:hypothetical protein [Maribacter spongiicola]TDT44961.1 hypothetical protein CLV90_2040 [Maribacter spongiicola]